MSQSHELINTTAFKAPMATAFDALPDSDDLDAGIGQSYGILSFKGKVWSLRHGGQTHYLVRDTAGVAQVGGHLDVILLGAAPVLSKSYFPSYNPDQEGRPLCAALNGETPDHDVQQKQANSCHVCPRNVWKTDARGKKSKECSDYKRVAVLLAPALTQAIMGEPLLEPVFLRVPPASLTNLGAMAKAMRAQGYTKMQSYVTRITFDPQQPHPQLVFKAIKELSNAEAPPVMEIAASPLVGRITVGDQITVAVTQSQLTQTADASSFALDASGASPTSTTATTSPSTPAGPSPMQSTNSPAPVAVPPATPVATSPSVSSPPPSVTAPSTDFTFVPPAGARPQQGPTTPNSAPAGTNGQSATSATVRDTGEPTLADPALDARINDLIKV